MIDTSGSCSGDLVERFLNKTYNILSQMKCFAQQIVLHIIQCDAAVQDDVRIKCAEHMEEYIAGMEFKGGGGPILGRRLPMRRSSEAVESLKGYAECSILRMDTVHFRNDRRIIKQLLFLWKERMRSESLPGPCVSIWIQSRWWEHYEKQGPWNRLERKR